MIVDGVNLRDSVSGVGSGFGHNDNPQMVAYLWYLSMEGTYDDTGTTDSPMGWNVLMGRWIVSQDDRGFVTGERFATRWDADQAFDSIVREYDRWLGVTE